MSGPIAKRVRGTILTTAILVVVASGAAILTTEYWHLEQQTRAAAQDAVEQIVPPLQAGLSSGDPHAIAATLTMLSTTPAITSAFVAIADGSVVAIYPSGAAAETVDPELLTHAANPLATGIRADRVSGQQHFFATPISRGGQAIGVVAVATSLAPIYALLQQQALILALVLLVGVLLAIRAGRRIESSLSEPVERLAEAMREVTKTRRYDVRLPGARQDEIGRLFKTFNAMVRALDRQGEMIQIEPVTEDPVREPEEEPVAPVAPTLDPGVVADVRTIDATDERPLLQHYVELFAKSAPQLVSHIRDSVATTNRDAVALAAHRLKNESAALGAQRLAQLACQLETAAASAKFDDLSKSVPALKLELARAQVALSQELRA